MVEPLETPPSEASDTFSDRSRVVPADRWVTAARIPRFGDQEEWQLVGMGRPANQGSYWGRLNFSGLSPSFNLLAREVAMCMLNPRHSNLRQRRLSFSKKPASPSTVQRIIPYVHFLQKHQVAAGLPARLEEWDIDDVRDAVQVPIRQGHVPDTVALFARWLEDLAKYAPALTGGFPEGIVWSSLEKRQWSNTDRSKTRGQLQTPPIDPAAFFPLVAAAAAYVQEFSSDILYARRRITELTQRQAKADGQKRWTASDEEIEKLLTQRHAFIPLHTSGPEEGAPNYRLLSLLLSDGQTEHIFSSPHDVQHRRRAIVSRLLAEGRGQRGAFDVRAKGHGARADHSWHEYFSPTTLDPEIGALRTACYIIIAVTTLMRDSEIQEIEKGALTTYYGAPAIRSRLVKGHADAPELLWWLHPVGAQAVEIAETLSDHETHIFSSLREFPWTDRKSRHGAGIQAGEAIYTFIDHVNRHAGETGLREIPKGHRVTPQQFRRTMAVQVGREPGGELALGLVLKHVSARAIANTATVGYATPSAAWLAEYDDLRAQEYIAQIAVTWLDEPGAHRAVGGPGEDTYNKAFDAVTAQHAPSVGDDSQLIALLRSKTPNLRIGTMNHCLGDKTKARCISGSSAADPVIDTFRCEPSKCGNSVITSVHIPLLKAELAQIKKRLKTRGISTVSEAILEARETEIKSLIASEAEHD